MEKKEIDALRKKYDLTKDRDILALYTRLQTGEYDLSSPEGRAFDDEIYELAMAAKKRQQDAQSPASGAGSKAPESSRKTRGARARAASSVSRGTRNQAQKQTQKQTAEDEKKPKKTRDVVVLTRKELMLKRIVMWALFLVMLACLGYFGLYVYEADKASDLREQIAHKKDNKAVQQMFAKKDFSETDEMGNRMPEILDDYKSLYNQNKNLIGWLKIADTTIDYPVMQTSDNSFYLNHDINQKEDKNGTLFLDAQCDVLAPSMNLIIYGHNMRSGNMFGSLGKYKSEEYGKSHSTILFDSLYEKGVYEVMYVFNSKIFAKDEIAFKYYQFIDASSEEEFNSNMRAMAEMSLYDTGVVAEYGDRLLTLSTCDYLENDSRFVVVAKKIG
ncbi:MAG: class B sortase [Lachnospiraceae bacterium]|nr:class B sortase [Lachnospiraceae bacterium]